MRTKSFSNIKNNFYGHQITWKRTVIPNAIPIKYYVVYSYNMLRYKAPFDTPRLQKRYSESGSKFIWMREIFTWYL